MPRHRRRRPPTALRRLHGRRARTLEEAILALLPQPPPPSPSSCSCAGTTCVACAGASRLLCDQDPAEYRTLLTRAFCVVDDRAPPPPDEFLRRGSDQRSIVRKVIELLNGNPRVCNNVLCKGYDQPSRLSLIGESLCTLAWDHLLTRIGDALMVFLLKYSSIYVPFPNKNYHQLTGIPLNSLIKKSKVLYSTSNSSSQQSCSGDYIRLDGFTVLPLSVVTSTTKSCSWGSY